MSIGLVIGEPLRRSRAGRTDRGRPPRPAAPPPPGAQVGADALGVALRDIEFQAGDTDLPNSTAAVGSAGAGMVSSAVANGRLTSSERPDAADTYRELLVRHHLPDAEALGTWPHRRSTHRTGCSRS